MNLYWHLDRHQMCDGLSNYQAITQVDMTLRDQVAVDLTVVKDATTGNAAYEGRALPAGWSIIFGVKPAAALSGGHLIYQGVWTAGSGTGEFSATLNLSTSELIAAMSTSAYVDFIAEFTLVDVDGNNRDSTQFTLRVYADVNRGGEAATTGVYLSASAIVREELIDGKKVLVFYNSDGVEYFRINPPGA